MVLIVTSLSRERNRSRLLGQCTVRPCNLNKKMESDQNMSKLVFLCFLHELSKLENNLSSKYNFSSSFNYYNTKKLKPHCGVICCLNFILVSFHNAVDPNEVDTSSRKNGGFTFDHRNDITLKCFNLSTSFTASFSRLTKVLVFT